MDSAPPPEDRRPFVWLTTPMKIVALFVGAVVSIVALMSLAGLWIDNLWIELGIAAVLILVVPLVLADRLLPGDGSSRPGLVSDVLAVMWMGGATTALALGTGMLAAPLTAQAARFDDHGLPHVAWATRWATGDHQAATAEPSEAVETETEPASVNATASPSPSTAESESESGSEPEPEPESATPAAGAEYTPAPADSKRATLEPAQLFQTWAPSVVTISVETPRGSGIGTGFVIDQRGTVATNHHVVNDATKIEIKLFDGTKADEVELLENNQEDDLALLRMKTKSLPPPVVLGDSAAVKVGQPVTVIGNPIGLDHTMTDGMVSSRRLYERKKYIQMSAPVSPGNSGGPVFDAHGDVIGVTVAKLWGENLNLAIPIDVLKPMIKSEYPEAHGFGVSRW